MTNQDRINELFEGLVPQSGKADTVAGEIIRATCRIGYRWCNDGDQIGVEYGNETCNCAARYLIMTCDSTVYDVIIRQLWGCRDERRYDAGLDVLYGKVLAFIDRNPGLKTTKTSRTCSCIRSRKTLNGAKRKRTTGPAVRMSTRTITTKRRGGTDEACI